MTSFKLARRLLDSSNEEVQAMKRTKIGLAWPAMIAWMSLLFAGAEAALARGPYGTLSDRGYEEMRRLAVELDQQARHTNDRAHHQGIWIYGSDPRFVRSVARFAERARRFRERMARYQTRPWQVDDELRALAKDARGVQARAESARNVDEHTVADWNQVVELLERMESVYQADVAGRPWEGREGESWHHGRRAGPPRGPSGYDTERLATLSRELVERAARAHGDAERLYATDTLQEERFFRGFDRFDDQARDFHRRIESGTMGPDEIRADAGRLLEEARRLDQGMRATGSYETVRREWQEVMNVLNRLIDLVGS